MFDIFYLPASAALKLTHSVFAPVLGSGNGLSWVLAIAFVVVLFRVCLYPVHLVKVSLWQRRGADRGVGAQIVVLCGVQILSSMLAFVAFQHVVRSFDRTGTGPGQLAMSSMENASTANYSFEAAGVQDFLAARFMGVPLTAGLSTKTGQLTSSGEFGSIPTSTTVVSVLVCVALLAGALAFVGTRVSFLRAGALVDTRIRVLYTASMLIIPVLAVALCLTTSVAVAMWCIANSLFTIAQSMIGPGRVRATPDPGMSHPDGRWVGSAAFTQQVVAYPPDGRTATATRPGPNTVAPAVPQTNSMAVLALVSIFVFPPMAILFGHIARAQIRRTGEQGDGMAIAGLVFGYLTVVVLILIVVAVAAVIAGSASS